MQRLVAVLIILLAGLSLLVSTEAFQVARPVNSAQVPIMATDQSALSVKAGPNNPFTMVTTMPNGRLVLDMTRGPGGATTFGFATASRYTLSQIITVTNTTTSPTNVTVTASGSTFATLHATGFVNGGGSALSAPIPVPAGQYVDINLEWTTGATPGVNLSPSSPMAIVISGN